MNNKILFLLITVASFAFVKESYAATKTSTGSGGWTSGGTWSPSGAPLAGDVINIQSGHTITISSNVDFRSGSATTVNVSGTLNFFSGGSKLRMSSGSTVVLISGSSLTSTGGGGASQQIEINGTTVWSNTMGNFTGPRTISEMSPLPVVWLNISADRVPMNSVIVNWSTSSEMSNSHFEVERSTNGVNFIFLSKISGKGTTNTITEYSWVDQTAPQGMLYYRLKQVDYNADFEYSNIMVVTPIIETVEGIEVSVFPNPVTEELNIDFSAEAPQQMDITFVDLFGNEVKKIVIEKGRQSVRLDVKGLKKGYYFLIIGTSDLQKSQRILVN